MKKPRLILVKPPEVAKLDFGTFSLGVLAAYLRASAEVALIDASHGQPTEAAKRIWKSHPDVVGITVMGLGSIRPAERFLKSLVDDDAARASSTVLVGGHGAAAAPARFLRAGAAAVVCGEGERTLQRIIDGGVEPGMPGIACLSNGDTVVGPMPRLIQPLDRLPSPARDLMPQPRDRVHLMETSRGCPHRCAFCETSRFYGSRWRGFSPQRVAAEVARLVDDHDAWTILLADDNFAASPSRVIEICRRLRQGPLPAVFLASVRADDLLRDPALIPAMAAARILRVTVGVESLEPDVARTAGKPIAKDVYVEAFERLRAHGIFSVASFITGLPGQQTDVPTVVEQAVRAGPDAAVFVPFIPMPNTPLAEGVDRFEPKAADGQRARQLTAAFFRHAQVRRRLTRAQDQGGIRGMLARAVSAERPAQLHTAR